MLVPKSSLLLLAALFCACGGPMPEELPADEMEGSFEAAIAPAASPGDYLLIDANRLASLPTSGTPYATMKKAADDFMAIADLSEPASSASPWLPNYSGYGAETLAAALVYARTGDLRYRDFVIRVNRFIIGSEELSSTNGTSSGDRLLATMRQVSAYVLAADLVKMDRLVTGSRSAYRSYVWKDWLGSLRTKTIGTSGNKNQMVVVNNHATNWGAMASASRITIDAYLNDEADLAKAVDRLKLYLGEIYTGTPWVQSSSYDGSWACTPAGLPVAFVPINPSDCGLDKDGIVVEDASRSAYAFPTWDKVGIDYSFHALLGQYLAAIILDRRGYDVWNWGNKALMRVMDRLDRLGVATGNGREVARHISWIPRHFYAKDYPTTAAHSGHHLGFTDWLYAEKKSSSSTPAPAPVAVTILGDQTAGPVLTKMSVDKKRASRFSFSTPSAADLTAIHAYVDGLGSTSGAQPVRAVIYSDTGRLLGFSRDITVQAGQPGGWITFTLPTPVAVPAGAYWLGLHSGGPTAVARYAASSATGALGFDVYVDLFSDGPVDPLGSTSTDDKRMSIYAVGTAR